LLMHGEPSWSYLYRFMIPPLVEAGYRVVAPDLVGFGRSDKPSEQGDYTYQRHVDWMTAWLEAVGLTDISLFCQDWGGLIGLRLVAERSSLFKRVVAANTFLPTGKSKAPEAFLMWQEFARSSPKFDVGRVLNNGSVRQLDADEIAAYDAPFPDDSYKAGARVFPALVPTSPEDPAIPACLAAWEVLRKWDKPFITAFSDMDPITKGGEKYLEANIPGANGQAHTITKNAGHFLQEDAGPELAQLIINFIKQNP
ncbi:MAG: haloalkane dehalogenase, partial [Bacteroidota bacterium]